MHQIFAKTFENRSLTSHRIDSQGEFSKIIEEDQSEGGFYKYFKAI